MNLRGNPTPSQRQQRIDELTSAVIDAAVNGRKKPPGRKPRGGGVKPKKKARSALSQPVITPTLSPLHVPPPPSAPVPVLVEEERVEEEIVERQRSASTTESPPATQNLPPPSAQPPLAPGVLDVLSEYFDREEEELGGPVEEVRPDVDDDEEDLDTTPWQVQSQSAPLSKKARSKQSARAVDDIEEWQDVRAQFHLLHNKTILCAFGILLENLNGAKVMNQKMERLIHDLQVQHSTDSEEVTYLRQGWPMATISAHGIKPIVTSLCNGDDIRELSSVVSSLFQKRKTTNLTVIVTNDLKQMKKTLGVVAHIEAPTTQAAPPPSKGRKRTQTGTVRETTTTREGRQIIIHEELETASGNHILALTSRYQCADKTCPHYGFSCYPFGKSHVLLDNNDLRMWNELIRSRKGVTIDYCPQEVLAGAVSRKQKAEGKKRQKDSSPRKDQPFGGLKLIIKNGSSGGVGQGVDPLRSSPPTFEGSETKNLTDYLNWLVDKGHVSFLNGLAA